jgi:hypothetical protein
MGIARLACLAKKRLPSVDLIVVRNFIYVFVTFVAAIVTLAMGIALTFLSAFIYREVSHISYRFNQLGDLSLEQLILVVIVLVIELVLTIINLVGRSLPSAEVLKLQARLAAGTGENSPLKLLVRLVNFKNSSARLRILPTMPDTAETVIDALYTANILVH